MSISGVTPSNGVTTLDSRLLTIGLTSTNHNREVDTNKNFPVSINSLVCRCQPCSRTSQFLSTPWFAGDNIALELRTSQFLSTPWFASDNLALELPSFCPLLGLPVTSQFLSTLWLAGVNLTLELPSFYPLFGLPVSTLLTPWFASDDLALELPSFGPLHGLLFRNKNLDELYYQYQQRLQHGYFSVFLLLQILLTVGHITVVIAAQDGLENTLPDVISYCVLTLLCCPLVLVVFKEKLVDKYPFVPFVSSCLVIVFLVVADLAVGIYHAGDEYLLLVLRPAYSTHALLACYMFLPLLHNFQPIILGATVTLCHLVTLGVIVYKDVPDVLQRVISDAIYLVCVNGLGLYFRLLNEVSIRRTFLDRRACIESKYKVDYEKQQEVRRCGGFRFGSRYGSFVTFLCSSITFTFNISEHLLLSILPRHIVEDVKEDIRRIIQHVNDPLKKKPFSDMYVKEHSNVSILFADVVNYSQLTVSLPVNKLVETLNELFGRFDDASETRNVLRIKFLGDCYNCVSGIPDSNPSHASSCVKLGLDMISIIRKVRKLVEEVLGVQKVRKEVSETQKVELEVSGAQKDGKEVSGAQKDGNEVLEAQKVRKEVSRAQKYQKEVEDRKLNDRLNMRIGVHSGKVFSGLLGVCKWQYDVWSHDVIIANHMEQAGLPGQVHVTKKTLELLGSEYRFRSGNGARRSSFLKKNNIETFFIVSKDGAVDGHTVRGGDGMAGNNEEITSYNRRTSNGIPRRITSSGKPQSLRNGVDISIGGASRRRMVFMDDNLQSYQQTLRMADEQMKDAISNMQVGVYE
uniref:adenylate cyclase n=1 Tax=Timema shepardi TaxID=629360 RepID=A0A7R9B6Q0_TIMSH|nr:unnamed protein product [Timema shepardi]